MRREEREEYLYSVDEIFIAHLSLSDAHYGANIVGRRETEARTRCALAPGGTDHVG